MPPHACPDRPPTPALPVRPDSGEAPASRPRPPTPEASGEGSPAGGDGWSFAAYLLAVAVVLGLAAFL